MRCLLKNISSPLGTRWAVAEGQMKGWSGLGLRPTSSQLLSSSGILGNPEPPHPSCSWGAGTGSGYLLVNYFLARLNSCGAAETPSKPNDAGSEGLAIING